MHITSDPDMDLPPTEDILETPSQTYISLPAPGSKYAPATFKGKSDDLEPFIEHYQQTCQRNKVTAPEEMYKGLLQYCSPKVRKTLRSFPSNEEKDYHTLLYELQYFYELEEDTCDLQALEEFTQEWRQSKIHTLKRFKAYQKSFYKKAGKAKKGGVISVREYDRYFWAGIPGSLRRRIESRMLVTNPFLDISIPFRITEVEEAAAHVLSPHRFDKYLLAESGNDSSETEEEKAFPRKHKRAVRWKRDSDTEEEDNESPSDTDHDTRPLLRHKPIKPTHSPPLKPSTHTKKTKPYRTQPDNDVVDLTERMKKLGISEPEYQSLYVQLIHLDPGFRGEVETPMARSARLAIQGNNQYPRDPPPHQAFPRNPPPPQSFPRQPLPPQTYPGNPLPPQSYPRNFPQQNNRLPQQYPNRPPLHCYGCGQDGHRIPECEELASYVKKGQVARNPITGNLQWPDGSRIVKTVTETWIQAINGINGIKQAKLAKVGKMDEEATIGSYMGVARLDDDADSEDQEELGWTPGEVGYYQAYKADRSDKISKDKRKRFQANPPNIPQRVKEFPRRREAHGTSRPHPPIRKDVHFNSNQPGLPKGITPVDIHQDEFEGIADDHLPPMETEQQVPLDPTSEARKDLANQGRPNPIKVTNPGARKMESSKIVQQALDTPLTVSLREAIGISPYLQRELVRAVKQGNEAFAPVQEQRSLKAGVVSDEDSDSGNDELVAYSGPITKQEFISAKLADPRTQVPTVTTTIGGNRYRGLFDSGSMVTIISEEMAQDMGLPWNTDASSRILLEGITGNYAQCIGKVGIARILITDSNLPTYSELYIKEGKGDEVILGRTWGTENCAGLRESSEGTYLSFNCHGARYEVNAAPILRVQGETEEAFMNRQRRYFRKYKVHAAKIGNAKPDSQNVSDSEETSKIEEMANEEGEPIENIAQETEKWVKIGKAADKEEGAAQDEIWSQESGEIRQEDSLNAIDDYPTPAQRREEISEGGTDETDPEDIAWAPDASPPSERTHNSETESEPEPDPQPSKKITETDLYDTYIKLVQEGASNTEWSRFCEEEEHRKIRDKYRWAQWTGESTDESLEVTDETDVPDETPCPANPEEPPHAPSLTLRTNPPSPNEAKKDLKRKSQSLVSMARRSRRTRHLTERAKGEEYQNLIRTYQRRERQSRRTQKTAKIIPRTKMRSCMARVVPRNEDTKEPPSESSESNDPDPEIKSWDEGSIILDKDSIRTWERVSLTEERDNHESDRTEHNRIVRTPEIHDPRPDPRSPVARLDEDEMRESRPEKWLGEEAGPTLEERTNCKIRTDDPKETEKRTSGSDTENELQLEYLRIIAEEYQRDKELDRLQRITYSQLRNEYKDRISHQTKRPNTYHRRNPECEWNPGNLNERGADRTLNYKNMGLNPGDQDPGSDVPTKHGGESKPEEGRKEPEALTRKSSIKIYASPKDGVEEDLPPEDSNQGSAHGGGYYEYHSEFSSYSETDEEEESDEPDTEYPPYAPRLARYYRRKGLWPLREECARWAKNWNQAHGAKMGAPNKKGQPKRETSGNKEPDPKQLAWEQLNRERRKNEYDRENGVRSGTREWGKNHTQWALNQNGICNDGNDEQTYLRDQRPLPTREESPEQRTRPGGMNQVPQTQHFPMPVGRQEEGDRDQSSDPETSPKKGPRGAYHHWDGRQIPNILQKVKGLVRKMNSQRGPYNLHDTEPEGCLYPDEEPEESGLSVVNPGERLSTPQIPLGLRYLPSFQYIPNGVLAAIDIFPFAYDEDRREHHFKAYGITLATDNRYGKPVIFQGDAEIRVTEPEKGIQVEVPHRGRTRDARDQVFRMNKFARVPGYVPNKHDPYVSNSADEGKVAWFELPPRETHAVLDDLARNIMSEDEEVRIYTIDRLTDGTLKVRHGIITQSELTEPSTQDPTDGDPEWTEERLSDETGKKQKGLTELGSDPPAPDQALNATNFARGKRGKSPKEDRMGPLESLENIIKIIQYCYRKKNEKDETRKSIKSRKPAHLENPAQLRIPSRIIKIAHPKGNGQYPISHDSARIHTFPQKQVPLPQESCDPRVVRPDPPALDPEPCEEEDMKVEIPPPEFRNPGLLTASHLVPLGDEHTPPGEASYFGYGAMVVGRGEHGSPFVHHGHTYIHLYNSSSTDEAQETDIHPGRDRVRIRTETFPIPLARLSNLEAEDAPIFPNQSVANAQVRFTPEAPAFVSERVTIKNEYDQDMTLLDAIAGLRALKSEFRMEDKPYYSMESDGSDDDPKPPLKTPHSRTTYRIPTDLYWTALEADNLAKVQPPPSMFQDAEAYPRTHARTLLHKISLPSIAKDPTLHGPPPVLCYPFNAAEGSFVRHFDPLETLEKIPAEAQVATIARPKTRRGGAEEKSEPAESKVPLWSREDLAEKGILETMERTEEKLFKLAGVKDAPEDLEDVYSVLGACGLLQITHDMGVAKLKGEEVRAEDFRDRILTAIVTHEEQIHEHFAKSDEKDKNHGTSKTPADISKTNAGDKNIEESTHPGQQEPTPPPSSPVDWYPDVEIRPYEDTTNNDNDAYYVPSSPSPGGCGARPYIQRDQGLEDELMEVKDRVSRLEDRVEEVSERMRKKLRELEIQSNDDSCELANLKWKEAELKRAENKTRADRKKTYRRDGPKERKGHRYPTRFSLANEDRMNEIKGSVTKQGNRIRSLEDRMENNKREIADIKEKLCQVVALTPRIEELAKTIAANQKAQIDTNSVLLSEVHDLRQSLGPSLEARLKQHEFEINSLFSRFGQFYSYATNILFPGASAATYNDKKFPIFNDLGTARESGVITVC